MIGSSRIGDSAIGGSSISYPAQAPDIPSVPGNDSPYPDEDAAFLQLLQWSPTTNFTIGIYTHSTGDHYLIKVASGKISAALLNLTEQGGVLKSGYLQTYPDRSTRSTTIGGSDEQIKYETYILGQAETRGAWVEIGTYRVEGTTLHYGWNFNWDGSSAVCVTQKQNVTLDGKLSSWTARVYYLSIVEDTDNEGEPILVASTSLSETADWEPTIGYPFIMEPDNAGAMVHWIPQSCNADTTVDGYGEGDFDAPVYVFYKADGSVEKISYSQEALPERTMAELVDEARLTDCPCVDFQFNTAGEHEREYYGYLGGRTVGFYTDEADYRVLESPGGFWRKRTVTIGDASEYVAPIQTYQNIYAEDWTHTEWDADECQGGATSQCTFDYNAGYVTTEEDTSNEFVGTTINISCKPLLIFPYHSPESVYISTLTHENRSSSYEKRVAKTGIEIRQVNWQTLTPVSSFVPVYFPVVLDSVATSCDDLVNDCRTLNRYIFAGGGLDWGEIPELTEQNEPVIIKVDISLNLITPFEHVQVDAIEKDSILDIGSYGGWFYPSLCSDPIQPIAVSNYQSVLGNSIRLESGFDYSYGSNNNLSQDVADPYGLWIGRA